MPDVEPRYDETAVIELTPPEPETIVVSGEGLSRIDSGGNETTESTDQQLSIAAEPTFAPEYEPDETVRTEYPEGFSAKAPTASESGTAPVSANAPGAMAGDPSQDTSEAMTDDVGKLTPETAALVTTTPDLTISETIVPEQETPLEPQQIEIAPGVQQQAVAQTQTIETAPATQPVQPAQPVQSAQQQAVQSVAPVSPQPTLSDGNVAKGFVRPVFLVRHVTGAPGDGNLSLRTAILHALRQADAMVTDNPAQASYVIQGSVQMSSPFAGRQHTRIVWLVTTITGEEVGTAVQENDIPQGSLDGKWGTVAQVIANAAVPGVAQLFDTGLDAGSAQGNLAQPDLPHMIDGTQP